MSMRPPAPPSLASRPTLLVVDDHEMNRDLLSRRLTRAGFDVVTAEEGAEALRVLRQRPIDLVLLDMMMPGMSGVEVLEALRRDHGPQELPVIMATARSDPADVVGALDLGANDYVTKPIDMDVLLARIRTQLRVTAVRHGAEPRAKSIGPGAVLSGKYRLEEALGIGGCGTVYRATHLGLDMPVAVKVLHTQLLASEMAVRHFRKEGMSTCRVKHPNAVAVFDTGCTATGVPYLVMELLQGRTLQSELESVGPLPLARIAEIVPPICDVLATAHAAGIVHRDIKPGNILLCRSPTGHEIVKVLDFGLAAFAPHGDARAAGVPSEDLSGTPQYMAPERLLGHSYDGSADVYSVGIVLYRMFAGRAPFRSFADADANAPLRQLQERPYPLGTLRPDLPAELVERVMAAIAFDAHRRPPVHAIKELLVELAATWREPEWPPAAPPEEASPRVPEDAPTVAPGSLRTRQAAEQPPPADLDDGDPRQARR